jgi:hypothetical protein
VAGLLWLRDFDDDVARVALDLVFANCSGDQRQLPVKIQTVRSEHAIRAPLNFKEKWSRVRDQTSYAITRRTKEVAASSGTMPP